MTTAYDGTTGGATAYPASVPQELDHGLDTLALLKQTVADRVEVEPLVLTVPGGRIRLSCKPDIPEKDLRRWQKAALPAHLRKNGNGTALDVDQLVVAALVLTYVTQVIEVLDSRDNTTWHVVQKDGEPVGLHDDLVLRLFGAMDPQFALTTIFGRESDVIRASQQVLQASGWAGENGGDDEADPR